MGCASSSEGREASPPPPPPAADPRCPLSPKQLHCMRASWKGVRRDVERTGLALFVKLFEESPELTHLFEQFRGLRPHELLTHAALQDHATKVMHTLDESIHSLRDMAQFESYVRHVGATHTRIQGFTPQHFWKIEAPFLAAARATLDERYSDNIRDIYTRTIRLVLANLERGYRDAAGTDNTHSDTNDTDTTHVANNADNHHDANNTAVVNDAA